MALERDKQEHFILNGTAAHILGTFCYSIASCHEKFTEATEEEYIPLPCKHGRFRLFICNGSATGSRNVIHCNSFTDKTFTILFQYKHTQDAQSFAQKRNNKVVESVNRTTD